MRCAGSCRAASSQASHSSVSLRDDMQQMFCRNHRLLLLWSFGMQHMQKADNEHAAREATSLHHPLHHQNGINGTSGSDRCLHQVGNSLCLPHHKIQMVYSLIRRAHAIRRKLTHDCRFLACDQQRQHSLRPLLASSLVRRRLSRLRQVNSLRNHLIAADSHTARRLLAIKTEGSFAAASAVSGTGAHFRRFYLFVDCF